MDKIEACLVGVGLFAVSQIITGSLYKDADKSLERGTSNKEESEETNEQSQSSQTNTDGMPPAYHHSVNNKISPGIALKQFASNRYKISFKYPSEWNKNPRYEDKYEGTSGFFEVGDFYGVGDNIDEVVKAEVNEPYKPYGTNPTIRRFVVDGQPARMICASEDQANFYKDRKIVIVIQYPQPIIIEGRSYNYVAIWASKEYMPLIISTFKFIMN